MPPVNPALQAPTAEEIARQQALALIQQVDAFTTHALVQLSITPLSPEARRYLYERFITLADRVFPGE